MKIFLLTFIVLFLGLQLIPFYLQVNAIKNPESNFASNSDDEFDDEEGSEEEQENEEIEENA
ncbi:MAG TPA: hypothetical protein PLX69_14855 [Leptospiraceae bacterium]|nr:hypothetical protein [Leptospiraceae bacterium]HRG75838.1 hypothetical protein [Leptospiraceae bacterium]